MLCISRTRKGDNMRSKTILFCGERWRVEFPDVKEMPDTLGCVVWEKDLIKIRKDSINSNTVLHEMFEAASQVHGCVFSSYNRNVWEGNTYIMSHNQMNNIMRDAWGGMCQIVPGMVKI